MADGSPPTNHTTHPTSTPPAKRRFIGLVLLILGIATAHLFLLHAPTLTRIVLGLPAWLWLQLATVAVLLGLAWTAVAVLTPTPPPDRPEPEPDQDPESATPPGSP